jgi:hypothetical protein
VAARGVSTAAAACGPDAAAPAAGVAAVGVAAAVVEAAGAEAAGAAMADAAAAALGDPIRRLSGRPLVLRGWGLQLPGI